MRPKPNGPTEASLASQEPPRPAPGKIKTRLRKKDRKARSGQKSKLSNRS